MNSKSKILYLYKLLYEKTDDENMLSTSQIIESLAEQGIETTRKTVASDIALLIEFGIDIITIRTSQNHYYIGQRAFELAEVKLLIDAILSSKIITTKKTKKLIEKISKLSSDTQSSELNRNIFIDKRIKPSNENVYYTIDLLHTAILKQSQVTFKYTDYDGDKKSFYKHNGKVYNLSPYSLAWNDDHYYVVGYCSNHKHISTFRVDRMATAEQSNRTFVQPLDDFVIEDYVKSIFDMYNGDTTTVELKCSNKLMKVVIDKFGKDVKTSSLGSNCFKAIVDVAISPTFFAWVFQFTSEMSILAPQNVKQQYIDTLEDILVLHK